MEEYRVKILEIERLTHNVKRFKVEKPADYSFSPGQATELSLDAKQWRQEKRPFTFTSLPHQPFLEFVIKSYPQHQGLTDKLDRVSPGEHFLIGNAWGAIAYKGPGTFIAGGAGVTPFICIFKSLHQQNELSGNRLIFSNKHKEDIILETYWKDLLGPYFHSVLTQEGDARINQAYLEEKIQDRNQRFYLCGPEKMTEELSQSLEALGAKSDQLVFEE